MADAKTDPLNDWMLEVTTLLERVNARMQAVEKSLDQNTSAVAASTTTAVSAAAALTRIAKTEEDRLAFDKELEARRILERAEDRKNREAWFTRIWSSSAVQLLLFGIVTVILNLFGLSYIADRMSPAAGGTPSPQEVHPAGVGE